MPKVFLIFVKSTSKSESTARQGPENILVSQQLRQKKKLEKEDEDRMSGS